MIAETIFFTVEMRPVRTRFYHDHEQGRPRGRARAFTRKRQRARAPAIRQMPDMCCQHVPGMRANIAQLGGSGSSTAILEQRASLPANSACQEILTVARRLATRSPDGSFTLMQVIAELRRTGTQYTESTIRTHVTSRMCADFPDHHGTTYDDLERLNRGRCRLRRN
jgi:hypothetical protein